MQILKCAVPQCAAGALLKAGCQCLVKYESQCPEYHQPVVTGKVCSCKREVPASCPKTHLLDPATCSCQIKQIPSCPYGTVLKGSAWCAGQKPPSCPPGTTLDQYRCTCVKQTTRVCKVGSITDDYCNCVKTTIPVCKALNTYNSVKCALNTKWCTCEPIPYSKTLAKNTA